MRSGPNFTRRVSSMGGRSVTSLTPRSVSGGLSLAESQTSSWMERGMGSVEFRRLHSSGPVRGRTATTASSPTEGSCQTSQGFHLPASFVPGFTQPAFSAVGFQVETKANNALPNGLPKSPEKFKGGLARALSSPDEEATPLPLPERFPSLQGGHDFFPDVDLTLLKDAQERHDVFKTEVVCTAYMVASRAYKGDQRLDGSSQLSHCMMAALQLADLGLDAETVASGLLHEVLRHSDEHRAFLQEFMPSTVVALVDRVTTMSKISQLYRNHRDVLGDEKLQHMLLAMEDVKAVIVKLACRVHNMKTISALPRDKQVLMAQETLDIYSVVANRLGVWCLKAELEDLAFSVLHPEEYEALKAQASVRQDPVLLEATVQAVKAGMDVAGVQYVDISGRPKNLYGIWKKMKEGDITSLNNVYDVTALRVVVTNKHDCYEAQRVVQSVYRCMRERSKDFIRDIKKPNGYQSLHETVYGAGNMPVEVQIRTHKMHYIAEYGFAAHWKYKEKLSDEETWMDKEVQYKKWLTAYKIGVHDKKVRPNGSPPTDSSLKALGMHLIDTSASATTQSTQVDPFLCHDRFKLEAPSRASISVVLQTRDGGVEARELPLGTTAHRLARELSVTSLAGFVLTVNQRLPPPGADLALQSGDLVQVLPMSEVLSRSPSEERARLAEQQLDIFQLGRPGSRTVSLNSPSNATSSGLVRQPSGSSSGLIRQPSGSTIPTFHGFFPTVAVETAS